MNPLPLVQGVPNPVPRVQHPDWLHKKIVEKNDTLKQRKISEMFTRGPKQTLPSADQENRDVVMKDIEDVVGSNSPARPLAARNVAVVTTTTKRKNADDGPTPAELEKNWKEVLGNPPKRCDGLREWIKFQKRKWQFQARQRREQERHNGRKKARGGDDGAADVVSGGATGQGLVRSGPVTMAGFLRRTQRTLMDTPWQIIQLAETGSPGLYRLWALVGADLHCIKLTVPRIFYVNQKSPKEEEEGAERMWRKCQKTLPRSHPVYHLYEYKYAVFINYVS